jgi:hypothetical protein
VLTLRLLRSGVGPLPNSYVQPHRMTARVSSVACPMADWFAALDLAREAMETIGTHPSILNALSLIGQASRQWDGSQRFLVCSSTPRDKWCAGSWLSSPSWRVRISCPGSSDHRFLTPCAKQRSTWVGHGSATISLLSDAAV